MADLDELMDAAEADALEALALQLMVSDAPTVARLCNACAVACEGESDFTATLLRDCADLLLRQHLMLQQASLLPRVEFQQSGSTH